MSEEFEASTSSPPSMVKKIYELDDDQFCSKVTLKHGDVSYKFSGPENGELVVCLHGVSGYKYQFRELAPCLARQDYRVLTFDFYGRGYSAAPSTSYDLALYVEQTVELLRVLKLHQEKMTLIGYSLGGAIAVGLAEAYPSLIRKLVLVAPAGLVAPAKELAPILKLPILGKLLQSYSLRYLRKNTDSSFWQADKCPELLRLVREKLDFQLKNKKGYKEALSSTLIHFPLNTMHESFCNVGRHRRPVMVIWGREDNVCPYEGAEFLKEKFKNLELITMENAAHMALLERAGEINSQISSFLSRALSDEEVEPDMKTSLSTEELVATAGLNFCVS